MSELPVVNCCTPLAGLSLSDQQAADLEEVFNALADRHCLKIVNLLLRAAGELVCVCEIQPTLELSQGTVSYHLRLLAEAGLIKRETRGTDSYYGLVPGALGAVSSVLS